MTTSTTAAVPSRAQTDAAWLRLVQLSVAVCTVPLVIYFLAGTFFTTIGEGDFGYTADYWYTAVGLPFALVGVGHTLGVHKLQHGADGRLGMIGVWVNALAMTELFAQILASVATGSEVRWGPAYPVFTLLTFVGVALLAAGSWRTGLLPRWMLGVWPLIWVLGTFGAVFAPMPLLLIAFFVVFGVTLTRRARARAEAPAR